MDTRTQKPLPLSWGHKVKAQVLGEQFPVTIRGWKEPEYIILDHPVVKGEVFRIAPQTGCTVSYTVDGLFINFKSSILFSIVLPIRLMIIDYPRHFISHNLRKYNRQKTNFDLAYSSEKGAPEITHTGTIRDLSVSGAMITHARVLEKGERVFLHFKLPQGDIANLAARVRNVRHHPKNERQPFVTGLEFFDLKPGHETILRAFVQSRAGDRRSNNRLNPGR